MARFVKVIRSGDAKGRSELPLYSGKMDDEELIDWFSCMDNYFEFDNIVDKEKVRIGKNRLKGHALLWWDCIQVERWKNSRPKISSWYTMMDKVKEIFLPSDCKV